MNWIRFTKRECDLFTAYCILRGYTVLFKKYIGKNFRNFLVINKNRIIHSYREITEYEDILQCLKKQKKGLLGILNKLDKNNKELNKFLKFRKFNNYNDRGLITLFKKFVEVYQNYFPLFTLPKYYGIVFGQKDLSKTVTKKLKKLRGIAFYEIIQDVFLPRFFSEVGSKKKIKSDLLFYALPDEIINLLNNKKGVTNKRLQERKKYCLFLVKNGKFNIYVGLRAKKIAQAEIKDTASEKISLIRGSTAYKGKPIRGEVRLVLYKKDLKNLDGKIIVTPMTSIRFIPYLKKVKAIITDEGGIACHAAIISRELKKPCIIGTKVATKALKDGDLVEVDANRGWVKILRK